MLAALELRAGRPEAALEYGARAAAICPKLPIDDILGLALYRLGRDREALEALERDFRRSPSSNEEAVLAAARLLLRFGDAPQALQLLQKNLLRRPDWTKARAQLEELQRRPSK